MQVLVKTRRIKIDIQGDVPDDLLKVIRKEFPRSVKVIEEPEEQKIDFFQTEMYRESKKRLTPGRYLRIYRENKGWSQAELGRKLGNFGRQNISEMERGVRGISKENAKKLAKLLDAPLERFI